MRLAVLLLLVLAAAPAAAQRARDGRFTVDAHDLSSDPTLTVRAESARATDVLAAAAQRLGLELRGLELIRREPLVDVYLVRRPARAALRWILGAAGLRARITSSEIHVEEDVPALPASEELYASALFAYRRFLRQYPEHPETAANEMTVADISADLGPAFYGDAVFSYDVVVDQHPDSSLVPDALLRSARLLAAQGRWEDATLRYHRLASLALRHHHQETARLELARALCHVGEGADDESLRDESARKALLTLDALDVNYPTQEAMQRRERLLVRALALALTSEPIRALKALDLAAGSSIDGHRDPEILQLRALALGRAGRYGDASNAWLSVAQGAAGAAREAAYEQAARAALDGGHELAVIFIHRTAEKEGLAASLEVHRHEAETRLALTSGSAATLSLVQQLERGARLYAERDVEQALVALRRVWARRTELRREQLAYLAVTYARALDAHGLETDAIDVLRRVAGELDKSADRRALFEAAADLHERHGRLEAAIDALGGKL
jgi:hypothetical protein